MHGLIGGATIQTPSWTPRATIQGQLVSAGAATAPSDPLDENTVDDTSHRTPWTNFRHSITSRQRGSINEALDETASAIFGAATFFAVEKSSLEKRSRVCDTVCHVGYGCPPYNLFNFYNYAFYLSHKQANVLF